MKRKSVIFSGGLVLAFVLLSCIFSFALSEGETRADKGTIFLHTGSPLLLSQEVIAALDPDNLDVAATVVNSRTLVPLRALSEYFGASVSYDAKERDAILKYEDKQYIFPINEKRYYVVDNLGKKEISMDSQSMIINNRTMLPIRVICENILGRKVSYYDRVIAISNHEIDLKTDTELVKNVKSKIGTALKARTMSELHLALANNQEARYYSVDSEMNKTQETSASTVAPDSAGGGYSTTNIQVEGIDEADVVKTDGKYIYIAGNNAIRIVLANKGKLSDSATIKLATDKNVNEIYVDGSRLVVLGTRSEYGPGPVYDVKPLLDSASKSIMPPYYRAKNYSFVDVYDISNPKSPMFLKGHEMEGYYESSRKNKDVVYLITNTYVYGDIILPMMKDTVAGSKMVSMKLDDIMIMPGHTSSGYVVISAININNSEKTEVEAITASGSIVYMNDKSLYFAASEYNDKTTITKFKVDGTKVGYAGSGNIKGYLLNQFSMDEYKGYLRVAATTSESENEIYVLDDSLNVYGSLNGLAKGERIYSVRFMGDKGYLVTYRNIDPLFVFDLSNPAEPVTTGELKVPGFSNYLYPVGENLILGIGADTYDIYKKDASGKEIVVGTRQGGIKLSLFDVSDMGKPKELSKYVVGDSGSYTEAFNNHKALMLDKASENVAFDATISSDESVGKYGQGAVVINYSQRKIALKGILDSEPTGLYGNYIPSARRLVYIGDELYYIQGGRISSYDYDNLSPIDSIILQ